MVPLLVMFGLSALGFAAASSGATRVLFIVLFVVWSVFVVVAVVALIGRLQQTRR